MAKDLHVVYGRRLPRLLWQKTSRSSIVDHLHVFYGKRIKGRFLAEDLKFSVKGGLQVIYSRRPSCLLWEKISRFLYPKTSESEETCRSFIGNYIQVFYSRRLSGSGLLFHIPLIAEQTSSEISQHLLPASCLTLFKILFDYKTSYQQISIHFRFQVEFLILKNRLKATLLLLLSFLLFY